MPSYWWTARRTDRSGPPNGGQLEGQFGIILSLTVTVLCTYGVREIAAEDMTLEDASSRSLSHSSTSLRRHAMTAGECKAVPLRASHVTTTTEQDTLYAERRYVRGGVGRGRVCEPGSERNEQAIIITVKVQSFHLLLHHNAINPPRGLIQFLGL